MKFFNYEYLYIASHGNPSELIRLFKECDNVENSTDFIINPKALVDSFWVSDKLKAEYLGLCALRNYEDYSIYKDKDLSLDLIPQWVPLQVIKENPLVQLTDNKLIFIKEENKIW